MQRNLDLSTNVGYSLWKSCHNNTIEEVLEILRTNTMNPKLVNYCPSGDTPLDQAITHKNEEMVLALLPFGAVSIYHATYMKTGDKFKWFLGIKTQFESKVASSKGCSATDTNIKTNTNLNTTVENLEQDLNYWMLQNQNLKAEILRLKEYYEAKIEGLEANKKSNSGKPTNFDAMTDEELEELVKKLENDQNEIKKLLVERKKDTCVICLTGARTHVLIPCGHKLFCGPCSASLQKVCPICRTDIQSVLKVFG
jgi:hypothetical protein